MTHSHIIDGVFRSHKKPKINADGTLEADKIGLSFKDPAARLALEEYARWTSREQLRRDIIERVTSIRGPEGSAEMDKQLLLLGTNG